MSSTSAVEAPHHHVVIIGTGFGGMATAVRLRRSGIHDFVMLERAAEVGGVWRDNDYPGAAVDIKSRLYSLSFAPNPEWSNTFARQPEIFKYLRDVSHQQDLRNNIRFNCTVERMDWDSGRQLWRLTTSRGDRTAKHVVVATGALADPVIPALPGIEEFEGLAFHSARWDHSFDVTGKRVAAIGTGPSAIQFIPAIQPSVGHMTVFQRTASWVVPRHDQEISEREQAILRALPALERMQRLGMYARHEATHVAFRHPSLMSAPERRARKFLAEQVKDPVLREKLTPTFRFGCKRVLISDTYLASLDQPNVDVVTDAIQRVTKAGIVDAAGVEHPLDAIIYGTGFHTSRLPLTDHIYGPEGTTMADFWDGTPTAYMGTSVTGFPNVYLIHGPNVGLGHNSVIHMLESQAHYISAAVNYLRDNELATVTPSPSAHQAFAEEVDQMSEGTVWTSGGCDSWYLENGRNSNLWPGTATDFRRRSLRFDPMDHVFEKTHIAMVSA